MPRNFKPRGPGLFGQTEDTEKEKPLKSGQCKTCKKQMPREFYRGRFETPSPIHCNGSTTAWMNRMGTQEHHGRRSYGNCWHCHQYLGCDQCAGSPTDVLCKRCAVWGTREAFAEHGPIANVDAIQEKRRRHGCAAQAPGFAEYPPEWRMYYRKVNSADPVEQLVGTNIEELVESVLPDVHDVPRADPADYEDAQGLLPISAADRRRAEERREELRQQAEHLRAEQ